MTDHRGGITGASSTQSSGRAPTQVDEKRHRAAEFAPAAPSDTQARRPAETKGTPIGTSERLGSPAMPESAHVGRATGPEGVRNSTDVGSKTRSVLVPYAPSRREPDAETVATVGIALLITITGSVGAAGFWLLSRVLG